MLDLTCSLIAKHIPQNMTSDTIMHVILNTIYGVLELINHTLATDTMIILCPNSQATKWSLEEPFMSIARMRLNPPS